MTDLKTLTIQSGENGAIVFKKIKNHIESTEEELVGALSHMPNVDTIIEKVQNKRLIEQKEEYEKSHPKGFEYASLKAQTYRTYLQDAHDTKQMKYLQSIVSYNLDGTMNILPLKKTFRENLSGTGGLMNHNNALLLAKSKGYKLLTDYNDTDTEAEKQATDFYKIINLFNPYGENTGDTPDASSIFIKMAGCDNTHGYWTATLQKDENGNDIEQVVRYRLLSHDTLIRNSGTIRHDSCVCGLKDMK